MRLARIHRRLTVLMAMAALLAFAGGAGLEPLPAVLAALGLVTALFWQPDAQLSARMERVWLPLALLLVLRVFIHVFLIRDDVVIPVVDLLFLLLIAEALRSLDTDNDNRLYSLSFALLLASTAYRPGLVFALAFAVYVGLATVALMVGHLRRWGENHGVEEVPIPRRFMVTTAALSGVILLFSTVVFLTFPRVTRGGAGRGQPVAASMAGFADEVSLGSHGSRIYGNPQIILRVEFPRGAPNNLSSLHWRGRSYDRFDGVRWSRTRNLPPSLAPSTWYERWGGASLQQEIYAAPLDGQVLFALHPLLDVDPQSRIQPIFDNAGDFLYWGSASPAYTATSITGRPPADALREANRGFIPARELFTQLPPLSEEIRFLADSLLAHLPTAYDQARALVEWFQAEFAYTLELPATPREATLEHFLLQRRAGHCEYFSTAMAVLLRTQGVPTREVNGFLGGEWSEFGEYLAVTQNQAHAWVEVWFPGWGWVPFDPTPAGGGEGEALVSWFWPGRFLFDALQHRWNRWVLDYSMENQFGLLQRTRNIFSGERSTPPGRETGERPGLPGGRIWWGVGFFLLALGSLGFARGRSSLPESTRAFLRLREEGRRGGLPEAALHSPLSLVAYLEDRGHPGAGAARGVVDGYLQDRFSGTPLDRDRLRQMRRALARARTALREAPFS